MAAWSPAHDSRRFGGRVNEHDRRARVGAAAAEVRAIQLLQLQALQPLLARAQQPVELWPVRRAGMLLVCRRRGAGASVLGESVGVDRMLRGWNQPNESSVLNSPNERSHMTGG